MTATVEPSRLTAENNRPGTVSVSKKPNVIEISIPLTLAFRLALRCAREDAKKTQAQFAKAVGMTQQQYARLEGTGSNPTLETIDRIASNVGVGLAVTKVLVRSAGSKQRPLAINSSGPFL